MGSKHDGSNFPGFDQHQENLILYIDTTGEMYEDYKKLLERLIKAKRAGDYDAHAAQQAFENRVAQGMRRYQREHRSRETWTAAERTKIAKHYLEQFEAEYQSGELEWLGGPARATRANNPGELTAADIAAAPMFTVFGGNRGRGHQIRDGELPMSGKLWAVFEDSGGWDEDVDAEMDRRELYGDVGGTIQRDDEAVQRAGKTRSYDDDAASVDAINAGYTLAKIPDAMHGPGEDTYRMYVLDKMVSKGRGRNERSYYEPLDDNQIDWVTGKKPRPRASNASRTRPRRRGRR